MHVEKHVTEALDVIQVPVRITVYQTPSSSALLDHQHQETYATERMVAEIVLYQQL